jgi:acyl carrier protein
MKYNELDLKKIFVKIFKVNIKLVNKDFSINKINKWDSLNHLRLILEIENFFDISFDEKVVARLLSYNLIKLELEKSKIRFI